MPVPDAQTKRNFVLFMPDQLRYDCLGCTGNPVIKTPNIDAFAKNGTLFKNCFTQASVCTQSRCSMFTGTYNHVNGHRSIEYLLQPHEDNLFKSLKANGYHVANIGPRGDLYAPGVTEMSVNEHGFVENPTWMPSWAGADAEVKTDIWSRLFYSGRRDHGKVDYDEAIIRSAITWLNSSPPEPFCLFLPLIYPHPNFGVTDPWFSMYERSSIPKPVSTKDMTGYFPRYMSAFRDAHGLERATDEHWAEIGATYYGMISRMDEQFGRVVNTVKANGLWDRTYSFFFTDHGEYLGDFALVEKWPSGVSNALTHEPLIVVGPDLPKGETNESLCEMVDLVPTIFELAGIAEHYPHNGKSLVPTIVNHLTDHKPHAWSEGGFLKHEEPLLEEAGWPYDRKAGLQHEDIELVGKAIACRDKKWTFVYRLYEPCELYDRENDVGEAHNLAALPEYASLVNSFRDAVLRWMVETADLLPFDKDPRRPEVMLPSPAEQLQARAKAAKLRSINSTNGYANGVKEVPLATVLPALA